MKSIRATITKRTSIVAILTAGLAFYLVYGLVALGVRYQFDELLFRSASSIATLAHWDGEKIEVDVPRDGIPGFQTEEDGKYFQIRGPDGKILARSKNLQNDSFLGFIGGKDVSRDVMLPTRRAGRLVWIDQPAIIEEGESENGKKSEASAVPRVWVVVAASTEPVDSLLRQLKYILLAAFGFIAVTFVFILPRLINRGLEPLDHLTEQAKKLDANSLRQPFSEENQPTELQPIVKQLNVSMEKLAGAFERERQFAGNAAHELRTPLAAIRTNAEVALRYPDESQMRDSLAGILSSSQSMQRLVERLLELTRLGAGNVKVNRSPVHVNELVQHSLAANAATFESRRITIQVNVSENAQLQSDPEILSLVIDNLIQNTARHASERSVFRIRTMHEQDLYRIEFENQADDLSPEDMDKLFEPLWTKRQDRQQLGTGLGLAIAAECVRSLGGTIRSELSTSKALKIILTLPVQS